MPKKIALVTGGSRGIGKAICYRLARDGYHVIVHYNQSRDEAEKIAKDIDGSAMECNFSSTESLPELAKFIREEFGRLDCLVHNAGIAELDSLRALTERCFDKHITINLKLPVFLTQNLLPLMDKGSLIFISSGCARQPTPDALSYAMSKAGIEIFAKSIYEELAPKIRVNVVAAGATQTDMYDKNYDARDKQWVEENNPMGRARTPEEIANVVAFLASEEASGMTGQTIHVNGGSHVV